jgi:hypothetical protein
LFVFGEYSLPEELKSSQAPEGDDSAIIPKLLEIHGKALFYQLSGNFNAFIYDPKSQTFFSINAKLGLYPAYYYQAGVDFMVSSRLGAFKKVLDVDHADLSVVMQHCLYNYPISSRTFIKGVALQPSASVLSVTNERVNIEKYWNLDDQISSGPKRDFKKSVDLIDEVLDRLIRKYCSRFKKIGLSLTGGWDGRLLLAYALKYLSTEQLLLYSHGTLDSPDVKLPLATSKKLNLNYIPVLLNEPDHLTRQLQWADDTVKFSDGIRPVTRLHYLYNMTLLRKKHGISHIMSGNGGSNLLKCTNYQPCKVFNRFVIELIQSDNYEGVLRKHYDYCLTNFPSLFRDLDWNAFLDSFDREVFGSLFSIKNKERRFLHFLLFEIERRYFGPEIQSYRHLVNNYSPFFDDEFITSLLQTAFISSNGNKGILKSHKISFLYAKLTNKNNKELAKEPTDRGFAMVDVSNPMLFPRMVIRYFNRRINRVNNPDFFSNKQIPDLYAKEFLDHLDKFDIDQIPNKTFFENYISAMSFIAN